jgi:hypothetical protein
MATAELQGERIVVSTVWSEKELVKLLPGARWDPDERHWHVPVSWTACCQLRGVFGDALQVGPSLTTWAMEERTRRVDLSMQLRDALGLTIYVPQVILTGVAAWHPVR